MKKPLIFVLFIALAATLAACGSSPAGEASQSTADDATTSITSGQSALTQEQLVVGSLQLEKTDMAISAAQAGSLLPLWQAYQSLLQSDTTAEAEISALLGQIEDEMTSEQLAAIAAMDVSSTDIATIMDDLGLRPAAADGTGGGTGGGFFGDGGRPEGIPEGVTPGQGPGGGQGAGGRQFPGGTDGISPEQIATFQAQNQDFGNRGARGGNVFLIRPLITLLESKLS